MRLAAAQIDAISAETFLVNRKASPCLNRDWENDVLASDDEARNRSNRLISIIPANFTEMDEGIASKWILKVTHFSQSVYLLCDLSATASATVAQPIGPEWLSVLYDASRSGVLDDHIIGMFDALEDSIYSDFQGLNHALVAADVDRLAPEFAVGIPRALFPLRDQMTSWQPFLMRSLASLARRGYDVHELFQGLI